MEELLRRFGTLGDMAADGDAVAALAALPWPVPIAIAALPVAIAVLLASPWAVVGTILLSALAPIAFAAEGGGPLLAATIWVAAVIVGLRGAAERSVMRRSEALGDELEALRVEMQVFLTALDQRARTVDEARSRRHEIDADADAG